MQWVGGLLAGQTDRQTRRRGADTKEQQFNLQFFTEGSFRGARCLPICQLHLTME